MRKRTEQVAWLILMLAFLSCIGLTIGIPLGARWYILNTTRPLDSRLQPRAGTVTRQPSNSTLKAIVPTDLEIHAQDHIELSDDASAFLLFYQETPVPEALTPPVQPIVTAQFYGETDVTVENASTPRFTLSKLPNLIVLNIQRGANIHITIEENGRATRSRLKTPHGLVELEEGTYAFTIEQTQTEFTVTTGRAHVIDPSTGDTLVFTDAQHTELTAAGIGEIRIGARDIMRSRNGDFQAPLEDYWQTKTVAPPDESGGTVRHVNVGDDEIVLFERFGHEHAETGITQEINQDIRGAKTLRVRARLRVGTQTLPVCGSVGTECPIMLRVYFTDLESSSIREWIQGFYAIPGEDSPFCHVCQWKAEQIQVPQAGVWYNYESPDLLPLLRAQNIEPASIKSIEIYASGHTYDSAIDEIAILVGE